MDDSGVLYEGKPKEEKRISVYNIFRAHSYPEQFDIFIQAAIILASRCNSVKGSKFDEFLPVLLRELIDEPNYSSKIAINYEAEFPREFLVPFLSPMIGYGWNEEFLQDFKDVITGDINVGVLHSSDKVNDPLDFYVTDEKGNIIF